MGYLADGILAVLGGIADVIGRWCGDVGEPVAKCRDDLGRLVCGKGRLGQIHHRSAAVRAQLEPGNVAGRFHDVEAVRRLAEGPDRPLRGRDAR